MFVFTNSFFVGGKCLCVVCIRAPLCVCYHALCNKKHKKSRIAGVCETTGETKKDEKNAVERRVRRKETLENDATEENRRVCFFPKFFFFFLFGSDVKKRPVHTPLPWDD